MTGDVVVFKDLKMESQLLGIFQGGTSMGAFNSCSNELLEPIGFCFWRRVEVLPGRYMYMMGTHSSNGEL